MKLQLLLGNNNKIISLLVSGQGHSPSSLQQMKKQFNDSIIKHIWKTFIHKSFPSIVLQHTGMFVSK